MLSTLTVGIAVCGHHDRVEARTQVRLAQIPRQSALDVGALQFCSPSNSIGDIYAPLKLHMVHTIGKVRMQRNCSNDGGAIFLSLSREVHCMNMLGLSIFGRLTHKSEEVSPAVTSFSFPPICILFTLLFYLAVCMRYCSSPARLSSLDRLCH